MSLPSKLTTQNSQLPRDASGKLSKQIQEPTKGWGHRVADLDGVLTGVVDHRDGVGLVVSSPFARRRARGQIEKPALGEQVTNFLLTIRRKR